MMTYLSIENSIAVIYLIALGKSRVKEKMIEKSVKCFTAGTIKYIFLSIYRGRKSDEIYARHNHLYLLDQKETSASPFKAQRVQQNPWTALRKLALGSRKVTPSLLVLHACFVPGS